MNNPFPFLTKQDLRLLFERAQRLRAARDEVLLQEGSRLQALFIIRRGAVRVERAHLGQGVAFARLGLDSVFGELSFLEPVGAVGTVVADEDVEVDVIDAASIHSLLASVPGFGARFYQSLAVVVARRLRATDALLPPMMVENVPQVLRFHTDRASRADDDAVPPSLVAEVEEFKAAMLGADRAIKDGHLKGDAAQATVSSACSRMKDALGRLIEEEAQLAPAIGAYVFRETFPLLMLSAILDRSYAKPRGYAGDFSTIELLYRDQPEGAARLGPRIDRWTLDLACVQAVKNRRPMMAETIRTLAAERTDGPLCVASLASGPARELFDVLASPDAPDVRALCIDIDSEALRFASETAAALGVADRMTFAQDNLIKMAFGTGRTEVAPQHLIYSVGLIDYLEDELVLALLDWIHRHLAPGGTTVIGNFDPRNPDRAFMTHLLEWPLIYRTADHLRGLFGRSRFAGAKVDVRHEAAGVQLFAFARVP
jgi:extracellular factor (EF) 3-hydroxypalmitic acid methyl ester biosynthesis protein